MQGDILSSDSRRSGSWQKTLDTICFMLERSDGLRDTDKAEIIYTSGKKHIIKGNFSVV
jgi:hypothetical protein